MNCAKCTAELPASVKFCRRCGYPVQAQIASDNTKVTGLPELPPTLINRTAAMPTVPVTNGVQCQRCRAVNQPTDAFCVNCGLQLIGQAAPTTQVPVYHQPPPGPPPQWPPAQIPPQMPPQPPQMIPVTNPVVARPIVATLQTPYQAPKSRAATWIVVFMVIAVLGLGVLGIASYIAQQNRSTAYTGITADSSSSSSSTPSNSSSSNPPAADPTPPPTTKPAAKPEPTTQPDPPVKKDRPPAEQPPSTDRPVTEEPKKPPVEEPKKAEPTDEAFVPVAPRFISKCIFYTQPNTPYYITADNQIVVLNGNNRTVVGKKIAPDLPGFSWRFYMPNEPYNWSVTPDGSIIWTQPNGYQLKVGSVLNP